MYNQTPKTFSMPKHEQRFLISLQKLLKKIFSQMDFGSSLMSGRAVFSLVLLPQPPRVLEVISLWMFG